MPALAALVVVLLQVFASGDAGLEAESCSSERDVADTSLLQAGRGKASTRAIEMPLVDDVVKRFNEIEQKATISGANVAFCRTSGICAPGSIQSGSYADLNHHMQGVQRLQGGSYFAVSGNAEDSQILFLKLGDETTNAPLASNMGPTQPPPSDARIANVLHIEKEFSHAGGLSVWGQYLAVGAERKCPISNWCGEASRIHFYDVSDPMAPKKHSSVIERPKDSAGATAIVETEDGTFLVVVAGWDSQNLDFYESKSKDLDSGFTHLAAWSPGEMLAKPGMTKTWGKYQNLNIVKQADGGLFLVGTTRTGTNLADLFTLQFDTKKKGRPSITKVAANAFQVFPADVVDFQAGAGIFVESDNSLQLYSVPFNLKHLGASDIIPVGQFR